MGCSARFELLDERVIARDARHSSENIKALVVEEAMVGSAR